MEEKSIKEKISPEELMQKCSWEGGIHEGLVYGLTDEMLDDSDEKFKKAFKKLVRAFDIYKKAETELEKICYEQEIEFQE